MLWLDGKDSNAFVLSGNGVLTWKDKSMRQRDASGINLPTYNSNTGVTFNGTNQFMTLPGGTFTMYDNPFSIFMVANVTAQTISALWSAGSNANPSQPNSVEAVVSLNAVSVSNATGPEINGRSYNFPCGQPVLFNYTYHFMKGRAMYVNGTLINSGNSVFNRYTNILPVSNYIGLRAIGNTGFLNGTVAECIVYNSVIQEVERNRVEGYLAWKWGIQQSNAPLNVLNVAPCIGWWDSTDAATVNMSGSTVLRWNDKSACNTPFLPSAVTANQIGYGRACNVLGNNPVILTRNGGVNNFMRIARDIDVVNTTTFIVCYPTTAFVAAAAGPTVPIFESSYVGTSAPAIRYSGGTGTLSNDSLLSGGGVTFGDTDISYVRHNSNNMMYMLTADTRYTFAVNGRSTDRGTAAPSASGISFWRYPAIGAGGTSGTQAAPVFSYWGRTYYGEIIIYNSALSKSNIANVSRYLRNKWAINTYDMLPNRHPYNYFPVYSIPFQPNDLSSCIAWYDASDPRVVTLSGSSVTSVSNKNFFPNALTQTAGTSTLPTLGTINGINALRFDGTSALSVTLPANTVAPSETSASYFLVAQATGAKARNGLFAVQKIGENHVSFISNLPGSLFMSASSTVNAFSNTVCVLNSNVPFLMSVRLDGSLNDVALNNQISNDQRTRVGIYVDGVEYTKTITTLYLGPAQINAINLGWDVSSTSTRFVGNIGEFLCFSPSLPLASHNAIESYLRKKWKLPAFPGNGRVVPVLAPTDIAGCEIWLDANDSNTMTLAGNQIQQWRDKVKTSIFTSSTVTYITDGTRKVVNFPSLSTMGCALVTPTMSTERHTFFVVYKTSTAWDGNRQVEEIVRYATPSPTNFSVQFPARIRYTSTAAPALALDGTNSRLLIYAPADYYIATARIDGSSQTIFSNGCFTSSSNAPISNATITTVALGSSTTTATSFVGQFAELIAYNRALDFDSIDRVHAYLGTKWGINVVPTMPHPLGSADPTSAPFLPGLSGGLTGWFDATDISSFLFSNTSVIGWSNKAATGNIVRTVASAVGTYNSTLRGVDLQQMSLPPRAIGFVGSMVGVVTPTNPPASPTFNIFGANAAFIFGQGTTFVFADSFGGGSTYATATGIAQNVPHLVCIQADIVGSQIGRLNGSSMRTIYNAPFRGAVNTGQSTATIGNATAGLGLYNELIVYDKLKSLDEIVKIEGYLAWKWNIVSNLPATHPYKNIRPL
jgi:hypothetical protein